MENEDQRRYQSIERCDVFLRKHAFPGKAVRAAASRLELIRADLDRLAVQEATAQMMLPVDGKEIKKRCLVYRKQVLSPIVKAAKVIDGFVRDTPGALEALKVPHPTDSAELHIEAGNRMTEFVKDYRTLFVREAQFDRGFVKSLRAATRALESQTKLRHSTRTKRSALIREAKALLRKGRNEIDLLTQLIDQFLVERGLQALWATAKRVGPRQGRPRDTTEQRRKKKEKKAKDKAASVAESLKRREDRKEATRQRKLQEKAAKQAKKDKKKGKKAGDSPAAAPVDSAGQAPPLNPPA